MNKFNGFSHIVGPEREAAEKCADLIFGNGAMTDAVICPNSPEDIPKVNTYELLISLKMFSFHRNEDF